MRRAGTVLLWPLWFAVVAVPWSETRFGLFANLAAAAHALVAAAWHWGLAMALGERVRRIRRSSLNALGSPPCGREAVADGERGDDPSQDAVQWLFAAGIGLGLMAVLNLLWGTFVGVSRAKFLVFDALLAALSGGSWLRVGRAALSAACGVRDAAHRRPFAAAGMAVLLFGTLPFALTPTLFPDTIRYHFGLVRLYETAGRIVVLSDFAESGLSLNWQMLYLGQIEVAGELAAQAFNWMTLPLLAAALALAAPRTGRLFAVVVALSTPFLLGVSATANNDLGVAFFIALMWLALRAGTGRRRWGLAGLFGGLAVGTKYPAAFAVAAVLVAAVGEEAWRARSERKGGFPLSAGRFWNLILFLSGGFLGVFPWLFRGAWFTGDPLYPSLSRWLPWGAENGRWVAEHYAREMTRYGGGMEGFARWLLAPWRATLAPDPWFESDLGLTVWLALPLTALALRGGGRARFVVLAAWFHGAAWAAGPQVTRFLAAAMPAFTLAAAEGWTALRDAAVRRTVRTLMLAAVVANLWLCWMALAETTDPLAWFLRHSPRDAYLGARSPLYRAARELERRTGGRGAVLLFGVEGQSFFANPVRASGPFDPKWIVHESAAAKSPEELADRLRAAEIRFLCLDPHRIDYLDRQFGYASWPDAAARWRFMEMVRKHSRPVSPELGEGLREIEPPLKPGR
ncbi:MAG: glycosyltransferase family 39 protein [Verrucomicrobiae bacterium]|nr:glycosyltransferase family 39 protein [Verrucomicrobiae bacterium]